MGSIREKLMAEQGIVPTGLGRLFKSSRGLARAGLLALGRDRNGEVDPERLLALVRELGELRGLAMKGGQLLSYIDATLPAGLREQLAVLQTAAFATPFSAVQACLKAALGPKVELFRELDPAPVAVASIGQVHRGVLRDGREVAVKVQHAQVEASLRGELSTARRGAAMAAMLLPGMGASVREVVDEVRTALFEECDFVLEASRQTRFGTFYAGHPMLRIPAVVPELSARTVLTSAWCPGAPLSSLSASAPQSVRDQVGVALYELFVGTLYHQGVFHADPHPGNAAIAGDGKVVIYDFGCVRQFDRATVHAFARLARAVRSTDVDAIYAAFVAFGGTLPADAAGRDKLRLMLRGFFGPMAQRGVHAVDAGAGFESRQVMSDKVFISKLKLPAKLIFLFRLRFGLYAVLAQLGAMADWAALESRWAEALERDDAPPDPSLRPSPCPEHPGPRGLVA